MKTIARPRNVDEYIASVPAKLRPKLRQLRKIIVSTAPTAEEKLSYGMPYYGCKGRVAYFALAKNHIGLYIPPPIIQEHARELTGYETAKATIRFPLSKKLPVTLIRKLIKARLVENELRSKKRK